MANGENISITNIIINGNSFDLKIIFYLLFDFSIQIDNFVLISNEFHDEEIQVFNFNSQFINAS